MAKQEKAKKMANITLDDVYREVREMRKELSDLKTSMVPEEEISEEEREELHAILKEMKEGHKTPWRDVVKELKGLPK